ncbi:MAG: hypothetical protein U0694_17095 [Anaerolineae bacterium]
MAVVQINPLFDEVLEFLASTPTPNDIVAFQPSDVLQQRASALLEKKRQDALSTVEASELEEFARLNQFMSMLKIRARKKLAGL